MDKLEANKAVKDYLQKGCLLFQKHATPSHIILFFSDEFTGNSVDDQKWITEFPYGLPFNILHTINGRNAFIPENVVVNEGYLSLQVKHEPYTLEWTDDDGNSHSETRDFTAGVLHTKPDLPGDDHDSGCFNEGKFCIRAKLPDVGGAQAAFWLFGWSLEVDVFEMFDCPSGEIQSNLHAWPLETCECVPGSPTDECNGISGLVEECTHPTSPADHDLGNLSQAFHEYCFEWTPFKMVWSLDGQEFRTFYRYYKEVEITYVDGNGFINYETLCEPVECWDIPINEEVTLWEHDFWKRFTETPHDFLDLILNSSHDDPLNCGIANSSEFIIDYIRVYQKNGFSLVGTNVVCDSDPFGEFFWVNGQDLLEFYSWEVSPGLEIIYQSQNENLIRVLPENNYTGPGWIRVAIPNSRSCYDVTYEKEVWVGPPPLPTFDEFNYACESLIRSHTPPSSVDSYDWDVSSNVQILGPNTNDYIIVTIPATPPVSNFDYYLDISNKCGGLSTEGKAYPDDCGDDGQQLSVSPNPTSGTFDMTIMISGEYLGSDHFPVETWILDNNLTIVKQLSLNAGQSTVDISSLPTGIYRIIVVTHLGEVFSSEISKF